MPYLLALTLCLLGAGIETAMERRRGRQTLRTATSILFGRFPHNVVLLASISAVAVLEANRMPQGNIIAIVGALITAFYGWRILRIPVLLKRRHELTDAEYMRFSGWTLSYPEVGHAYELKEAFFEIWDCQTRHQAQEAYYAWLRQITPEMKAHFDPLIKAMGNWHDDIFAYFDHPITNAYTESLNNLIRVVNRVGRGYSFEALRAKILFTEGFQKIKKPGYQRQRIPKGAMGRMPFYGVAETGPSTNYGVDISTLAQEIEAGRL